MHKYIAVFAALAVMAGACAAEKEPTTQAAGASTVTAEDVVEVDDLVGQDADEAGAAKLGEPAIWRGYAAEVAKSAHMHVKSALQHVKDLAVGEPTRKGTTKVGSLEWAVWEKKTGEVTVKLVVIKVTDKRRRYILFGKKGTDTAKVLLTGVFVKAGKKTGGGRFHINLGNVTAISGATPALEGSIHFWFSNKRAAFHARRIVYRGVKASADKTAVANNAGMDYVRLAGKGGRFRAVAVGPKVLPRDGVEAMALRMVWATGKGGRLDGVIAAVTPVPVRLAEVHECWNAKGLREAYKDDVKGAEKTEADAGDVTKCGDFAPEKIDEKLANENGQDKDDEADAEFKDAGASDIDEATAGEALDPEA
ncbi:MAG: hypothetical protein EXR79_10815 [Myxococcales bacterium]|nr:hypothetical protein [Myxococcales bacterium]